MLQAHNNICRSVEKTLIQVCELSLIYLIFNKSENSCTYNITIQNVYVFSIYFFFFLKETRLPHVSHPNTTHIIIQPIMCNIIII